jgi:hypothetical protein
VLSGEKRPDAEDVPVEDALVDPSAEDVPVAEVLAEVGPAEDAVLLFVGGPLDGRVEIRAARHGEPLPTVTHVHLHDGPKVVHRYDLQPLAEQAGVYTVRPPGSPGRAQENPVPPPEDPARPDVG